MRWSVGGSCYDFLYFIKAARYARPGSPPGRRSCLRPAPARLRRRAAVASTSETHGALPHTPALSRRVEPQARGRTVDVVNVAGCGTAPSLTGHPRAYPEPPGAAMAKRKRHGREPWRPLENPGAAELPDRGGNHPAQSQLCRWRRQQQRSMCPLPDR